MAKRLADVKRKVRALLNTAAADSGATAAERMTATRMAENLMAKHRLTYADVPERETSDRAPAAASPIFTVTVTGLGAFGFTFNGATMSPGGA